MKAKSGKKIEAVKPQDPEEVFEADEASPGKIAEAKASQKAKESGKYGETKLPPHKPVKDESGESSASTSEASTTSPGSEASASAGAAAPKTTSSNSDEKKKGWIGLKLVDEDGNAVVGESYEVKLPDGTLSKGTLGADGAIKVEGFDPGKCVVTFPKLVKGSVSKK